MIQSPLQMTKDFITLEYLNIHVMNILLLLNNEPECTYESNEWLVGHLFLTMLRACYLDWRGSWVDYVLLAEFMYNNSYQASIGMAPFEALYGCLCRSPLCY